MAALVSVGFVSLAHAQAFDDGTHLVPGEVAPGTYSTPGAADCRWLRLSRPFPRDPKAVIQEGGGSIFTTVTIQPGDAMFASWRCGSWWPGDDAAALLPTYQDANAAARFVIEIIGLAVGEYVTDPAKRAEIRSLVQTAARYYTGTTPLMVKYADLFWEASGRR